VTLYEEVRAALRETDFRPKKRFGQNFLIHERVIDSMLRLLDPRADDEILEIGPGLGFLTRRLAQRAHRIYAVELEERLIEQIKCASWVSSDSLRLIHGDILQVSLDELLPAKKIKVAANLPYSIATAVLFRLLEAREHFSSLVVMVQKEVADRIASAPAAKSYGMLSVWCQIHGAISEKISVAPEAFFPKPKVKSTILRIDLFAEPRLVSQYLPVLRDLLRAAFGQRRKTLSNAMISWLKHSRQAVDSCLLRRRIDPNRRGETLTVDEFIELAQDLADSGLLPANADC
jgi:16S rRNA (adenine1518-N6/adenine1519-N6)-dimethyltransferase